MSHDPATHESETSHRGRLRFSLKAVMVLVTFVCVLLGYFIALHRTSDETIARNHAALDLINQRMSTAPRKTRREVSPLGPPAVRKRSFGKGTQVTSAFRTRFLGMSVHSARVWENRLAITRAFQAKSSLDVAKQLLAHYETGLAALGLQRVLLGWNPRDPGGISDQGATAFSIWQSSDHGMSIAIDIDVNSIPDLAGGTPSADVRIIFTHNEQDGIW